jgi:SAM-dependent methyltransferase
MAAIGKELTFDDFRKMAADKSLSGSEKIGFPDSYRSGYTGAILKDIFTKLPFDNEEKKVIIDIGSGCDELTFELIRVCQRQQHLLVLIDSEEMLANIPESEGVVKIPGKFPFKDNELDGYIGKADYILCYSVLFYVFANDNLYQFLHEALNLLASNGRLLLGDIPNIDKRDRFLQSEEGRKFVQNAGAAKGATAHDNNSQKMDDTILLAIIARLRRFGCETYIMPQNSNLPMANRREDILVVKR